MSDVYVRLHDMPCPECGGTFIFADLRVENATPGADLTASEKAVADMLKATLLTRGNGICGGCEEHYPLAQGPSRLGRALEAMNEAEALAAAGVAPN